MKFNNTIPSRKFAAEPDRYVLYVYPGCPWAHRTTIARILKGLEHIIQVVELDGMDPVKGWCFSNSTDPIYGVKYLRDLYLKADPNYNGRVLVPMLWDKKHETIISSENSVITRLFISAFDELLPPSQRESSKGDNSLLPPHLESQMDDLNTWTYNLISNGVYKAGYARSQASYEEAVHSVFKGLDLLEAHLSHPEHRPFMFGSFVTEADIRIFPSIVRFDAAYHPIFKCNLKMVRHDYPQIHNWLRRIYWDEGLRRAFRDTTDFEMIKRGYTRVVGGNGLVPLGPLPYVLPLTTIEKSQGREHRTDEMQM